MLATASGDLISKILSESETGEQTDVYFFIDYVLSVCFQCLVNMVIYLKGGLDAAST